ncbi:hypothetical protein AURDEDRAFT_184092 [Auricularia subglabra TFB-10046 SS5]|nr:hypothetical protein AURDEDRAFT_184092 [Auricularia subglabra TFB-10046 SS5]
MAFRPTGCRLQRLSTSQLAEAREYAASIPQMPLERRTTMILRPSRVRTRILEHLLNPLSAKPVSTLGSGIHWLFHVDPPDTGSWSLLPSGSPRRVSMSLSHYGLGVLPSAFTDRVWAGGKLTWSLGPRRRRREFVQQFRITEGVDELSTKDLGGERPMFKLHRRFSYAINCRGYRPLLVEERIHAFMPEVQGVSRRVRPVENLPVSHASARFLPDSIALFKYSAASQNPHRIHYDYKFARSLGFEDVVVHGPLTATLLLHFLNAKKPVDLHVHSFDYRALNSLYVDRPLTLHVSFLDPPEDTPFVFDPPAAEHDADVELPYLEVDHVDRAVSEKEEHWHNEFHSKRTPGGPAQPLAGPTAYKVGRIAELWSQDVNGVVGMRASALLVYAPPQRLDGFPLPPLEHRQRDARLKGDLPNRMSNVTRADRW